MSPIIRYTAANARMDKGQARQYPNLSVRREGAFRMNKATMKLLGVKAGDHVEVLHDQDANEWYLRKGDKTAMQVRTGKNHSGFFHSVILHDAFMKSVPDALEGGNGRFLVAREASTVDGVKCHAVLTSSAAGKL